MKPWKDILIEAKKLTGTIGKTVYRRTKLLVAIFNDREFRADNQLRDDGHAADWLDKECPDVALGFLDLRELLDYYPKESDWTNGRLKRMQADMYRAKQEEHRKQAAEKPKPHREKVTKAKLEELTKDRDHWKTRTTFLESQLRQMETEPKRPPQSIAAAPFQTSQRTNDQPVKVETEVKAKSVDLEEVNNKLRRENRELRGEVVRLRKELEAITQERDAYKTKFNELQGLLQPLSV